MGRLFGSPARNLVSIVGFVLLVSLAAVAAYLAAGWSLPDALYMVVLTIYTVGYEEVRPIDTPFLHFVTVALITLGCTGMILLTGALVQLLTFNQIQKIEDEAERAEFIRAQREEYSADIDILHLASEMVIDAVIEPDTLRSELIQRFALAEVKSRHFSERRNPITPA